MRDGQGRFASPALLRSHSAPALALDPEEQEPSKVQEEPREDLQGAVPVDESQPLALADEGEPVPVAEQSWSCGDSATATLSADGTTLTISGSGAMSDFSKENSLPWNGIKSSISNVVIGDGVTSIGNYAFGGCEALGAVTFPESVTLIGGGAFAGCTGLTTVTFQESTPPTIEGGCFSGSGVTSVTRPHGIKKAFENHGAERGVVGGYDNGLFGPDDNITRQQLAAMLWRYAGSPAVTEKELRFTGADQAGGYALEALRWAAEKGVLNGYGDGRLNPGGPATRAQAAQMLKNALENQEENS